MDYSKIINILFSYPFLTVNSFAEKLWVSRQAITKTIKKLEENNIVKSVKIWTNILVFIPEFVEILS
jgi:Mn-dependent DtxR family transcriptional regulator